MSEEKPDFENLLKQVETGWKYQLFQQTQKLFKDSCIPSHNEWHHLRVWKYASEILYLLNKKGIAISESEILELMIAVFFHDTGLSISQEQDHGKYSREICEKFLRETNIPVHLNTEKVLKAIEYHDDKTYTKNNPLILNQKLNIAAVLNIADDLDAFGIIGVYRYIEIYLLRNIPPENFADKVIPNLKTRFYHFKSQCIEFQDIVNIHQTRYQQTLDFFKELDKEFQKRSTNKENNIKIKIILFIQEMTKPGRYTLKEISETAIKKADSDEERLFFEKLLMEEIR
jgi:HD domain